MNTFLLEEIARSTAIYDLSVADDDQDYHHESETDGDVADERDNDEQDDIGGEQDDLDDEEDDSDDEQEHIPTAPWFTTEEINVSSGNCSNMNPLNNDLFEGQNFADKQTAISAIKSNHIKNSRNYHVTKSDTTRYQAKCVVEDCSWRVRVMKSRRSGLFVITKLPAEHICV